MYQPGSRNPRIARQGYTYHNVIYHQAANQANFALAGVARTLVRFGQPIIMTTAHGLHAVVASGMWASSDPVAGYPADVNAVNVWDPAVGAPGGGYQSSRLVTWPDYSFDVASNGWGPLYSANGNWDPDPAVGVYVPNSQYPSHWIGYQVDIEPDTQFNVSVDYALDENGNVMLHP